MNELQQKYIGKYIGESKIADIQITDFTTPLGSTVFSVTTESGEEILVTEKSLVISSSEEKVDVTTLYTSRLNAISEECIKVIAEYDVPSYLFDRVAAKIQTELRNHIERAASIVWFGSPKKYAPGFDTSGSVTLLQADRINRKFSVEDEPRG